MIKSLLEKIFKRKIHVPDHYKSYAHDRFINTKPWYKKYNIGDFSYGAPEIFDWSADDDVATMPTTLTIGKFCSLADVKIVLGSEHRIDWISTYPFNTLSKKFRHIKGHPSTKGDIIIGNDVWIATNVTILSGVTIGDGAVIGANSLVTNDVPPYHIAAGVPAKIIKPRFSKEIIEELQELKWWNLSIEVIEKNVELLQSSNIEEFIREIRTAVG